MGIFSGIGAAIGGLLGGSSGGSRPAGNTTNTTTSIQDVPDWVKPYLTGNLTGAQSTVNRLTGFSRGPGTTATGFIPSDQFDANAYLSANPDVAASQKYGGNPYGHYVDWGLNEGRQGYKLGEEKFSGGFGDALMQAAMPEYAKTIRGDYLDPSTNPYLDATYKHSADLVGSGVDSRFESSGRYGSGAHQGVLQEGFNNLATNIFGGNYQAERSRQQAATLGVPAFNMGTEQAALYPYTAFNSLIPNLRNTSGTSSEPFFTNPLGSALSGALAGGQIGGGFGDMFGGMGSIFGGSGAAAGAGDFFGSAGAGDLASLMMFMA